MNGPALGPRRYGVAAVSRMRPKPGHHGGGNRKARWHHPDLPQPVRWLPLAPALLPPHPPSQNDKRKDEQMLAGASRRSTCASSLFTGATLAADLGRLHTCHVEQVTEHLEAVDVSDLDQVADDLGNIDGRLDRPAIAMCGASAPRS